MHTNQIGEYAKKKVEEGRMMSEKIQVQYMVMSFSYKSVDIAMREALNFSEEESLQFLRQVNACDCIRESVLLSTCNRMEIYVSMIDKKRAKEHIFSCLCRFKSIPLERLMSHCNLWLNQGAIYHIFCVASSLDSLVIGETQITGQLKSAYKFAFENSLCARDMTRLMHFAFKCAANVRKQTDISSQSVSIASACVQLAESKLNEYGMSLHKHKVLVIGSGEMGRLVCKHLQQFQAQITLLNRSRDRARVLIEEISSCSENKGNDPIVFMPLSKLSDIFAQYDVVFSATGASGYIIDSTLMRSCDRLNMRFYFDLALPRDIEPLESAHIYCVDDIQQIVSEHKNAREESAKNARKIVETFSVEFFRWLQTLGIDPVIKHMRQLAKDSCLKELERAIKKGYLPESYRYNVEKILHGAFNTFLHKPTIRLRQASENPQGDPIIEAVKSIFDISDEVVMLHSYKCERDTTF